MGLYDYVQILFAGFAGVVMVLNGVHYILSAIPGDQGETKIAKVVAILEKTSLIFKGKK